MLAADPQVGRAGIQRPVVLRIEAREDLVIARAVTVFGAPV